LLTSILLWLWPLRGQNTIRKNVLDHSLRGAECERQHVAAIGRRVSTLCKGEDGLHQQLGLYHVYYNFCLPHTSMRQPLPQPVPTNGTGTVKRWQPQTPAMAAGLTDHVWTLREVLLFRVPPWPQPQAV
jgi:hypothetical protein